MSNGDDELLQQLMAKIWDEHKKLEDAVSNKTNPSETSEIGLRKEELIKQLRKVLDENKEKTK